MKRIEAKIQLQLRSGGTVKGKEGIISKKGKREGYEISLRGYYQIAKFATLISLAKTCGFAARLAVAVAPAVLASLAPILKGKEMKKEMEIKKELNSKSMSNSKSNYKFAVLETGPKFAAADFRSSVVAA